MPKGVAKGKKLIAVPSELVSKLNELANRDGIPFHQYIACVLEEAVKVGLMKRTMREVVEFYEVMKIRKASGCVLVPLDILSWLIKKLYPEEKDALEEMWLNAGRWFGKLLMLKFEDDTLSSFVKMLKVSEWQFEEVDLEEKGEIIKLRMSSFSLPEENTELLMQYITGAIESLGYEVMSTDRERGIISFNLKKR